MSFTVHHFTSREEWLEARLKLGVGSSEVAALFTAPGNALKGMSSWESPYSLCSKKRGLIPQESEGDEAVLDWGRRMEPAIAQWFEDNILGAEELALGLYDPGDWTILKSDDAPLFCTPDRLLVNKDGISDVTDSGLEIKNASAWISSEWEEEPPITYQLQVQAQMLITGCDRWYVCASIGGQPPKWAKLKADPEIQAAILERVRTFWASVEAGVDPEPDAHPMTAKALLKRWPEDNGETVMLGEEYSRVWEERQRLHEAIKKLDLGKAKATNLLKAAIGEATFGQLPDRLLSLKTDKAGRRMLREESFK